METVAALAVIAIGVPLHFAYGWSNGSPVVAAVAPANESVWEHLKLIVVPVTLVAVLEATRTVDRRRLWWAKLVEIGVASAFVVTVFYTYTGAFGVGSITGVDIGSYFVAVAIGQWTSCRMFASPRTADVPLWVSALGIALVLLGFAVLTFVPPHFPLFQEISTGTYGPG